jgi:hypothetical protein
MTTTRARVGASATLLFGLAIAFGACSSSNNNSPTDAGVDHASGGSTGSGGAGGSGGSGGSGGTAGTGGSGGTAGAGGAGGTHDGGTGGATDGGSGGSTDGGAGGTIDGGGTGGSTDGGAGGTIDGGGTGGSTDGGGAGGSTDGGAGGSTDGGAGGSTDGGGTDGGGTAAGILVISVPYTSAIAMMASNTYGPLISASFPSATVVDGDTYNFTMCVSPTTASPSMYTFQPFVTSFAGAGTYGATQAFSTLSTCPTMTTVSMAIPAGASPDGGDNQIGLWLRPVASDGGTYGTATLEVDSIALAGPAPQGPYTFDSTVQGFAMANFNTVTGTTVTWQATP